MPEPEAAVAIVQAGSPPGSILLIRRSEREDDSWSGHWSLPGGRRDPDDPDILHTALRELAEECGIELSRDHLLKALAATPARRRVGRYLLVAPFLFHVESELPTKLDAREAVNAMWVPASALLDPARQMLRAVPGRPGSMLFPCIELDGHPLWGFTYRLLTDWLGLACKREAGFHAAREVLEFLTSQGLTKTGEWRDDGAMRTVTVQGPLPAAAVLDRFGRPGPHVAATNCLEVSPERIRIMGPEFEEYLIISDTSGSPRTPPA
jgi:8-oxo-dGTP pyrophosphatase MutT (NUDIX family)